MDRRISLESVTVTRDATGGVTETWAEERRIWAEIVRQDGRESVIAGADRHNETRQFRIRHLDGLREDTHRIIYQGKTYDIRHIEEEGRSNRLLITATANQSVTV
jgi:SPP1 family predicted phage head-tail adaptor